jgi:hypothetical protein
MADPSQNRESGHRGSGTNMHRGLDVDSWAAPVPDAVTDTIAKEGCADG